MANKWRYIAPMDMVTVVLNCLHASNCLSIAFDIVGFAHIDLSLAITFSRSPFRTVTSLYRSLTHNVRHPFCWSTSTWALHIVWTSEAVVTFLHKRKTKYIGEYDDKRLRVTVTCSKRNCTILPAFFFSPFAFYFCSISSDAFQLFDGMYWMWYQLHVQRIFV